MFEDIYNQNDLIKEDRKLVSEYKAKFISLLIIAANDNNDTKKINEFLFEYYQGKCSEMLVGTGDVPSSRSFYEHCGFAISHRIKNFFTDNYDHPMYEDDMQLVDMIYLKKTL